MRKFLISAALISATAISAPAAAQNWGHGYDARGGQGIERKLENIERRIYRAAERRQISRGEANRLLRQANQIDRLAYRFGRNGINRREHFELQRRVDNLQQQLRWERREDRRRWR